jgi:hypothetical protein
MSDLVVTQDTQTVIVQGPTDSIIVTGLLGPVGPQGLQGPRGEPAPDTFQLSDLKDIDLSQLGNGSTLVYRAVTNTWAATNLLDQQVVECGQF